MNKDLQAIIACIHWAVNHGYNPYDSTVTDVNHRAYRLLESLDKAIDNVDCLISELLKD